MTKETYDKIVDDLKRYSEAYYKEAKSLISDKDFDLLMKQAEEIEEEHPDWIRADSPTKKPGSDLTGEKVKHSVPMLSLENTYNIEEVESWFEKMQAMTGQEKPIVVLEPKYDGLSFSAHYVNGVLVRALTRGDGEYGEDITQNCKAIPELGDKKDSNFTGEVRGEIIMTIKEFERLNADGKYANPRNLAVGTIKLLDIEEFKKRKLTAYVYFLTSGFEENSHYKTLSRLKDMGFNTGDAFLCSTVKELMDAISKMEQRKPELPIDIDGAVMKLDRKDLWKKIGGTSKFPHWAKAYKYEPDTAITRVRDIEFWVGQTGKITPVAMFEPVFLSGTKVNKATINNKAYMEAMDIMVGDMVDIKKAAEIIPFINHVVKDLRSDGHPRTKVTFPTRCPTCGSKLEKYNDEHADYYCMNEACQSRVVGLIVKYTSTMEIDGFAETVTDRLFKAGILKGIEDLYTLKDHKRDILLLERMGEKLFNKWIDNIEASKTQKLEKFIAAIGIKNVGTSTGKELANKFKDLKIIMGATKEELMEIDDIGEIVAESIYNYFRNVNNRKFITNMLEVHGLKLENPVQVDNKTLKLEGKNFCITGALSLTRDKYVDLIESLGGKVVSAVTKTTHYLITNDKTSGSSKNTAAQKLAIPILNEKEVLEMCGALNLLKMLNY